MSINGLPVAFFVVAGGIVVVLVSWLLMRFGRTIAKAVMALGALVIGGVIALSVLAQGAASFQTANAAKETARVAQKAATGNLLLVGMVGCAGGVALMAVAGALAFAGVMWYRAQQVERQVQPVALPKRRQRPQRALPEFERVVYVDSGDDFDDLVAIGDLDGMRCEDWV